MSEDAFFRQLKAAGMTQEKFYRAIMDESLAQAVIKREITSTITVTDAQVKSFYDTGHGLARRPDAGGPRQAGQGSQVHSRQVAQFKDRIESVKKSNLARLEQPEKVRVSHVFFTTRDRKTEEPLPEEQKKFKRQQLEKIRQKALAGEDFAKLVQQFSEDRGLKETKGEYTLSRDDRFVPEFKAAAFSLAPGKISDIVTSDLGLHIIKLLEKIPVKKTEFEKVAPDLKEFLTQQERAAVDAGILRTLEQGSRTGNARPEVQARSRRRLRTQKGRELNGWPAPAALSTPVVFRERIPWIRTSSSTRSGHRRIRVEYLPIDTPLRTRHFAKAASQIRSASRLDGG